MKPPRFARGGFICSALLGSAPDGESPFFLFDLGDDEVAQADPLSDACSLMERRECLHNVDKRRKVW